jgi:hypothetical protein
MAQERSAKTGQANRNRTTVQTKAQGRRDPAIAAPKGRKQHYSKKNKNRPP